MSLRNRLRPITYPIRQELRSVVTLYPALYYPLVRLGRGDPQQLVHAGTEIVIEGFPRCGNSFAVDAFRAAQGRPVTVAHHLHAAAQVVAGVRRGLPTLLLVREPEGAVVSFKALQLQASERDWGRPVTTSLRLLLRSYARFYERVWPLRDGIVVASFEQVTGDLGRVIERVNDRFGTAFTPFEHTDANVRAVLEGQRYHAGPSEERHGLKDGAERELETLQRSRELAAAHDVFQRLEGLALQ